MPQLAPPCPPPNTSPHACRMVHVRAAPHPAPPRASRSITAWHVPLWFSLVSYPTPCVRASFLNLLLTHVHAHSSPRLSRTLSVVPFTCLTRRHTFPSPSVSPPPCPPTPPLFAPRLLLRPPILSLLYTHWRPLDLARNATRTPSPHLAFLASRSLTSVQLLCFSGARGRDLAGNRRCPPPQGTCARPAAYTVVPHSCARPMNIYDRPRPA